MDYSRPSRQAIVAASLAGATLVYPTVVYATRSIAPSMVFVVLALALICVRVTLVRSPTTRDWRVPLICAGAILASLAMLNSALAAKAYPVAISSAAVATFATSLLRPPSLIEQFARIQEPNLSPEGQSYCHKVTIVWTAWLTINTAIAAGLALWGSDAAWAIWTGFLAYVCIGILFFGEIVFRKLIRRTPVG